MADVPSFVFSILNKELYELQRKLLEKVALDHNLDPDAIIKKYIIDPLQIVPNTTMKVEVVRRAAPKTVPDAADRCMARVWNRGKGGQCSRRCISGGEYCMGHKNGGLRHGRIDQPPPDHIFGRTREVYK